MWIVDVPDSARIIVRLGLRRIKEAQDGAAVSADIVVNDPPVVIFALAFVVWLVVLLERVVDAVFENLV